MSETLTALAEQHTAHVRSMTPGQYKMHVRDSRTCACGHDSISHGSYTRDGVPVGTGDGPCGFCADCNSLDTQPAEQRTPAILTFRQFATRERLALVAKYDVPLTEVFSLYPDSYYASEWLNVHVVKGFEAGANISRPVWRTLTWEQQQRVLRTHRALRDDTLTRELMRTSNSPGNKAGK